MKVFFLVLGCVGLLCADEFPEVYNSEKAENGEPMAAEEAAKAFEVPEGFEVSVFAAEPEVRNPIAMAWDQKGRMWVAENYTYAEKGKRFDLSLRDRIVIFEDADGDGKAERRKVFSNQLQMLTSVEVQPGGVWAMCPPRLLFIPDADGNDVPDGEPEVVLDGFTVAKSNFHNFANGLRWGPDGWLYGRCGGSCPGEVGVPGTPDAERVPLRGGIWRYHPKRKFFEVIVHGTTNPWGHDWDENGEGFFINTVNGHLWHMIPGAHFERPFGKPGTQNIYEAIQMHADHWHFDTQGVWQKSRNGAANDFGGGHSHIGMCIYQGDQLPEEWQGKLLTWNQHGRRLNMERLEREGSGYVARHEADQFLAGDEWFRGVDIREGPDGALYGLDWSDTGECHDHTGVHRTSGRIYRFSFGEPDRRGGANGTDVSVRLRELWDLKKSGGLKRGDLEDLLSDSEEHMRVWAIRLLTDEWPIDSVYGPMVHRKVSSDPELRDRFVEMAKEDESGLVRLALASTLQRMAVEDRAVLACALAGSLLRYIARSSVDDVKMLQGVISLAAQDEVKAAFLLKGILEGFKGWRKAAMPENWPTKSVVLGERHPDLVRELSVLFGDGRAVDSLKEVVLNRKEEMGARKRALEALVEAKVEGLRPICEQMFRTKGLCATAVKGLVGFDDAAVGQFLVKNYRRASSSTDKAAVINALVTRPAWAGFLLDVVEKGSIPRAAVNSFHARQILAMNDMALSKRVADVWGEIRQSDEVTQKKITTLENALTKEVRVKADKPKGRVIFQNLCASCHRLYGEGGKMGPDLTGSGRSDLGYLLENIIAPNSVVPTEYQMSILTLKDGRTLTGVVSASGKRTVTLRTLNDEVTLQKNAILETKRVTDSMMPPGLVDGLSADEVRDLIGYLMHPKQVELPEKE